LVLADVLETSRDAEPGQAPGSGTADWVAAALEGTLKARAPELHASTRVVGSLSRRVAQELGLDSRAQALLDVSVRVRDIGMISLPDAVVRATAPLPPEAWELINRHPPLGADLLDCLHPVSEAAQIVRGHHERWDGDGYPEGRQGETIPLLSRIIGACDAFVAMASDRPYRRGMGGEAALEQVCRGSGTQFDPRVVDALMAAISAAQTRKTRPGGEAPPAPATRRTRSGLREGQQDLRSAIQQTDVIPAFATAHERLIGAAAAEDNTSAEMVGAIETDTGLTLAILRAAQDLPKRGGVSSVVDAVSALGTQGVLVAASGLPLAQFPWQNSPFDALLHRVRIHAQAVARAAERIARESAAVEADDVLVPALLHDVGKLVLALAGNPLISAMDERVSTPEQRLRQEQQALGIDHASLGALMLGRWGLPQRLAATVGAHHTSSAANEIATYVRLADMVVHQAQGEAVDRATMLRLGQTCGLSGAALRDVLFDLPHAGGSRRRRSDPSPLTKRETEVLRLLAGGKVYKVIGSELGLSVSTIRTHLNHVYEKLGVVDRAQAVLRATEMGWI
jgi:putative nucleotidyltransferase with HDIG domain